MSGVIYEDMVKPWLRVSLSEVAASRVMKLTVVLTGTLCVTLVFLVEKLTGLIQVEEILFRSVYSTLSFVPRQLKVYRASQPDRCSGSSRWACSFHSQIPR